MALFVQNPLLKVLESSRPLSGEAIGYDTPIPTGEMANERAQLLIDWNVPFESGSQGPLRKTSATT